VESMINQKKNSAVSGLKCVIVLKSCVALIYNSVPFQVLFSSIDGIASGGSYSEGHRR
jgi:hypothetical protein